MIGDVLKYRIPGNDPVSKKGRFHEVDRINSEGFVVTSFTKDQKFIFIEGDLEAGYHFKENPYKSYSQDQFFNSGKELLHEFEKGELKKAVLSRPLLKSGQLEPGLVFERLCEKYPDAFVYLISSSYFGTWTGATPEILLKSDQGVKSTMALAGTKRSEDASSWSNKELAEHKYVVDRIERVLSRLGVGFLHIEGPSDTIAGPVKHLKTTFTFKSNESDSGIVDLLHPTPAIAGTPVESSIRWIKGNESYDRQLYTGMIGILGSDSNVYVNLRCMQIFENEYALYLGGGWTNESTPEKEWEETENKALTLLQVLEMK